MTDQYVIVNHKKLKCGYTTGSCAAAAAKAAAWMLLHGIPCENTGLITPAGVSLLLPVEDITCRTADAPQIARPFTQQISPERLISVSCAVRKDGGDDIDATHGLLIYAEVGYVRKNEPNHPKADEVNSAAGTTSCDIPMERVLIDGGEGVGRVTKPGLDQPIGNAAINHVPRKMIRDNVSEVMDSADYRGVLSVMISVPNGQAAAEKTFNPRLGIVGGISILGTSGIVYPMSEKALVDTIRVEMKMHLENGGRYLLITPGNYGERFADQLPALSRKYEMKCSNFIGETLDMAVDLGVEGILFVSHIGKFIKLSGGIMNTHSHEADCRAELMASAAIRAGGNAELAQRILETNTTEDALDVIYSQTEEPFLSSMMQSVCDRIEFYLNARTQNKLLCGAIIFSSRYGLLGQTSQVPALMQKLDEQATDH